MMRAEWIALAVALTKAARPVTAEGIRLLAEGAMPLLADRNDDESLMPPDTFYDWVTVFALASATRMPEAIPLPTNLPGHWPANDAT